MDWPRQGVVILHGNTLDLYEGQRRAVLPLLGRVQAQYPKHDVVGLSPDRGFQPLRVNKERWEGMQELVKPCFEMGGGGPMEALDILLRTQTSLLGIVDFAEFFVGTDKWLPGCSAGAAAARILRWSEEGLREGNLCFCISRHKLSALHPALREGNTPLRLLRMPLPTEELRVRSLGEMGAYAGGLTLRQLRESGGDPQVWQTLQAQAIERQTDGTLTSRWCNTPLDWLGGHSLLKDFVLKELVPAFKRRSRYSPMGVLCAGGPGTGKSVMAEIISSLLEMPLTEWVGSPIRSSFVGENEDRMVRAKEIVDETGGVLFMDEGDKMFNNMDGWQGDSGVSMRIQMILHQWLAETKHRGRILILMNVNRPRAVPASMRRAGRFDVVLPFFPPQNSEERVEVLRSLCTRYDLEVEEQVLATIAGRTVGFTGADLEAILMSMARAENLGKDFAREVALHAAPAVSLEEMQAMDAETVGILRDKRLLPERMRG